MEVKHPSQKCRGLSLPDCNSDLEEKEVSDDDDDDHNHKHRRWETRSQSLETDSLDQVLTRTYRKREKPFLNGFSFRNNGSQGSASWKNYNLVNVEKDLSGKFDRRRVGSTSLPRAPLDANLRNRINQSFSTDPGLGRGSGSWNQRDSWFTDTASQMVQLGSLPSSVISGTRLPNAQNAFGLIPGMPNGGLDAFHSIGLQGTLRPPIHSSLNMGITRPHCRDSVERGFCLRGDMCPMEHGFNRIVIDDVESLSQFNLPVSLPSAALLGPSTGPGSLASVNASSTIALNSKGSHNKSSKHGAGDGSLGSNGPYLACAGGDFYDPDQPLWNNNVSEASNAPLSLCSSKIDETGALLNVDPSDSEFPVRSTGIAVGSRSTIWGRIGSLKSRFDVTEKIDHSVKSADYLEKETTEEKEELAGTCISHQGKWILHEDAGSKPTDSFSRAQIDTMRNIRKSSQKATRTLFVNGIPQESNKREALLAHFQNFGEVIDMYIPIKSERAFVQFSRGEDAEAALQSPDAVMGNRFIGLWWANHDSISDDNTNSCSNLSATPHGVTAVSVPPQLSIANSSKDNLLAPAPKSSTVYSQDASLHASDYAEHVISNGSKVPPAQKKLDGLEQLKEELRKKEELLEQKRNDFWRKLDKIEKQLRYNATGQKTVSDAEPTAKRSKVGKAADTTESSIRRSSDAVFGVESPHAEMIDKNKAREDVSNSPITKKTTTLQETPCSKQQLINPFASAWAPFMMNRYKLDNRPTVFRVLPPLPAGFADYGDLSNVELEDVEVHEDSSQAETSKDCLARITFKTRCSAEKAFASSQCWQGHYLKFTWLTSSNSISGRSGKQNSLSTSQGSIACDAGKQDASSGNKEYENEDGKNGVERMDLVEDSHSTPSLTSEKVNLTKMRCDVGPIVRHVQLGKILFLELQF